MPTRVLFITARADIGGGQECLFRLAKQTHGRTENFIASPREEPYWAIFSDLVGDERMIEIPHRKLSFRAMVSLTKFVRRNSIDIVHSHGFGAGLYSRPIGAVTNVPVVHTFHGTTFQKTRPVWTAPRLCAEWTLALISRELISVSESEKRHLKAWLRPHGHKITRIYNGVEKSNKVQGQIGIPGERSRIVWIGRMHEQKDPLQLLEIAKHLKHSEQPGSFVFEIIGDGPLMSYFKSKLIADSLEDVISIRGAIPNASTCLKDSDIFLSTSRWEGLPTVILEAMNSGSLVVASNVSGNLDLIEHQRTGLLFEKSAPRHAAELISFALHHKSETKTLRDRAKTLVSSQFGVERCAAAHLSMYTALMRK